MLSVSGIYRIVNTVNGKQYIGSAVNIRKRWGVHRCHLRGDKHHSAALQRAWNKYGEDAFMFSKVHCTQTEDLLYCEQWWLDMDQPEYNVLGKAGSSIGRRMDEQQKDTIRKARTGVKLSEEHKIKISLGGKGRVPTQKQLDAMNWTGKKHSEKAKEKMRSKVVSQETRQKLSIARKGKKLSEEHRVKVVGNLEKSRWGHKVTEETKQKIRDAAIKQWSDPEKRKVLSNARKNISDETRAKMSAAAKARGTQKRKNRTQDAIISFGGRTLCVQDWAVELGIKWETFRKRLYLYKKDPSKFPYESVFKK